MNILLAVLAEQVKINIYIKVTHVVHCCVDHGLVNNVTLLNGIEDL
jgi:hypothetical protein